MITKISREIFCWLALAAVSLRAGPVANFSDGGSTDKPLTTRVDSWIGQPGGGWSTAWSAGGTKEVKVITDVRTRLPLEKGSPYLAVTITHPLTTSATAGSVRRQYAQTNEVRYDQPHRISFLYRLDSDLSHFERIRLFDSQIPLHGPDTKVPPHVNATWLIIGTADGKGEGRWKLCDTDQHYIDALPLIKGDVYRFTITLRPANGGEVFSYSTKIEDLTQGTKYESPALRGYKPEAKAGGFLTFSFRGKSAESASFSLAAVRVTGSK